jgi:Relaxase/Mobilisation nuclease domain
MPKQTVRLERSNCGPARAACDMALDIVSYGRRGPGGNLRFGVDQIAQVQRTVTRTPEVMVKVSGGGRDEAGVGAHLRYIGRHGKLPIETDDGLTLQGRGAVQGIVSDWQLDLCRSQYKPKSTGDRKDPRAKLVHNIVLSMPAGTPAEKVLAASRLFARENFALQYRYAMVLHTDQPHPHVHLVVKCEHEFEPGKRLYIRKDTLRQWREQFAALMREQGVAANATPRQVRGQIRKPFRDAMHHRLRALRTFEQLPSGERATSKPPKTSVFMLLKLKGVLQALRSRRDILDIGEDVMQRTRRAVVADWLATAEVLRRQGQSDLADCVDRFLARMPAVQTDARRMADRWSEQVRSRASERTNIRPSDEQTR